MSISEFKKIILVSSVSIVAAFGLVGCGDDDSSKTPVAAEKSATDALPDADSAVDDSAMKNVKEEVEAAVEDVKEDASEAMEEMKAKAEADAKTKAQDEMMKHMPQ